MKISVIIPTYNRVHLLPTLIEALLSQDFPREEFEIVVADDGSTDGTREYLQEHGSELRAFAQEHSGAARARNLAVGYARGEILAFTDDDCRPERDWLKVIDASMSRYGPKVTLLGHTYSKYPSTTFVHSVFKDSEPVVTCNFAIPRVAFEQVGGFDEHFVLYFEDEDLGLRLKKSGYPVVYIPAMGVEHPSRYQSFRGFLSLRSGLQYLCYMSQKHPDGDHWERHKGVVRQIERKAILFGVPLVGSFFWLPMLAFLLPILVAHFVVDGRRAWDHRRQLVSKEFRPRMIDLLLFTFLSWAVPFVDAFRIVRGCVRDRGRARAWLPHQYPQADNQNPLST